ncbi:MAG TPA: sigma-70 family RNA polymerase sigma factor [Thermoanaerobaculia bacterium]|nr:sigma-70 family RNA polymerase sigma factor [Thermoanaerobaculia bacterium]
MPFDPDTGIGGTAGRFPPTRATIVAGLRGGDASERDRAIDALASLYWKPLYKHVRIRWNRGNEDAKDLVQGFFAHAIGKEALEAYDPSQASFRTWIRLLFDRYLANETKSSSRLKRGGSQRALAFDEAERELARQAVDTSLPPDEMLYREWVRSLFSIAIERLRAESSERGRQTAFEVFHAYDVDRSEGERLSYADLAERFGVPETTITNHLSAMRRRFRETALETLREATASEQEFRAEARALFGRT